MKLFDQLAESVTDERHFLLSSPIIVNALRGDITRPQYVAFLKEAYFHVRHTVPLLMACGSRLRHDQEWLREAVAHYIDDEYGHEKWILNDIRACGANADAISGSEPSLATELMVSYAYDMIERVNPVGFFGMVYVLEGTSVTMATRAAHTLKQRLELGDDAFTYLTSHGSIDQEHIQFLEDLLNRIADERDRACIIHSARRFFYLYAQVFRTLPDKNAAMIRPDLREVA